MLAWSSILVLWIAFLSLILHDATKDDAGGSAVVLAAKNSAAYLCWAAKNLRAAARNVTCLLQAASSTPTPVREDAPSAIEQPPATPPKKTWWSKDNRVSIAAAELELAIADGVKATPGCEDFVGVVVQRKTPESRLDPNWEVR